MTSSSVFHDRSYLFELVEWRSRKEYRSIIITTQREPRLGAYREGGREKVDIHRSGFFCCCEFDNDFLKCPPTRLVSRILAEISRVFYANSRNGARHWQTFSPIDLSSSSAIDTVQNQNPDDLDPDLHVITSEQEIIKRVLAWPIRNECTHFAAVLDPARGHVAWLRRFIEAMDSLGEEPLREICKCAGEEEGKGEKWIKDTRRSKRT